MNAFLAFPELAIAAGALALLLVSAWGGERAARAVHWAAAALLLGVSVILSAFGQSGEAFGGVYIADGFRTFAKIMAMTLGVLALIAAPPALVRSQSLKPEYAVLVLLASLGMMLMLSARDFIVLYVGLEMQNLALYVLAGFRRDDPRSSEAAVKYFALGALASCVLLFGLSLIYGTTGATGFVAVASALAQQDVGVGMGIGLAFVLAGFAFKISAAPFHMWTPDVYEGAPTPVVAFLATAPKIAALGVMALLVLGPFASAIDIWQPIVIGLAVLSMMVGAFGGLRQEPIKRLMAFSTTVNVGTMLLALVAAGQGDGEIRIEAVSGLLLYLVVYTIATLLVFGVLLALTRREKTLSRVGDFAGLGKTHPLHAMMLAIALFSLAGVPPLAGFFGKYVVLFPLVKSGFPVLALFAVLMSVVAAGYYLRLVKIMYFDLPVDSLCFASSSRSLWGVSGVAAVSVATFVLLPAPLIDAARSAAERLVVP